MTATAAAALTATAVAAATQNPAGGNMPAIWALANPHHKMSARDSDWLPNMGRFRHQSSCRHKSTCTSCGAVKVRALRTSSGLTCFANRSV